MDATKRQQVAQQYQVEHVKVQQVVQQAKEQIQVQQQDVQIVL